MDEGTYRRKAPIFVNEKSVRGLLPEERDVRQTLLTDGRPGTFQACGSQVFKKNDISLGLRKAAV